MILHGGSSVSPDDFGIEGPFDAAAPGTTGKLPFHGVAWYRKSLDIPAADQGKQIYLDVDGAMAYPTVWVNGQFAGGWPYGYASLQLDLTPFSNPAAKCDRHSPG